MSEYIELFGLRIAKSLHDLVRLEIAPGTQVSEHYFWSELANIVRDLGPVNALLLHERAALQHKLDEWHLAHVDSPTDLVEYKNFLAEIGYLVGYSADGSGVADAGFTASTANVDAEIAHTAGPQLVVPVDNERYALNAANARWGSLYDALYGTDMIAEDHGAERRASYNSVRGKRVEAYVAQFLDQAVPLDIGKHCDIVSFSLDTLGLGDCLRTADEHPFLATTLNITLADGTCTTLADSTQFVGYTSNARTLRSVLLKNHALHLEIMLDADDPVGSNHPAGIKDVIVESALTTIQDCEDSVAAVDAQDKTRVYRNWNGIMQGNLQARIHKSDGEHVRRLNPDRHYIGTDGKSLTLSGRALMLVRNVGLHMYTDAVLDANGEEIAEGFLDAMVTALAAKHDLVGNSDRRNSRTGSVYIVKPKLHGPDEVAFTVQLFSRVEDALGLARNTLKIGIMDEERRTSINLRACIREARERVIFINTGFLDRTGDEIHSVMEAGAVLPKAEMKAQPWLLAYEDNNVDAGLATGLAGRAQIGKGMWAMPDEMKQMVEEKIAHPQAGASTAWVPSPTAATLHAMHYHQVEVSARQHELATREPAKLDDILSMPLLHGRNLSAEVIGQELQTNAQSILGYVVRWIDHGVGCSKVPDLNNVGLMEDRATLRISSQHIANWLHHGLVTREQVIKVFQDMAQLVDGQNANDVDYRRMTDDFERSIAFQAALDLVFKGREQANGYTEWTLHLRRREAKNAAR